MGLEPGQLVTKQVRLVRLLKSGGMGSVWVAEHTGLHTQVAVKVIQGNHEKKPELAERFHREASAAARIKSPHVVQIHDHGVTEAGDPYMIMELIEGEDMSARIKRQGPMPLEDVGNVMQQMARVLTKAHALGIVHRDIKPSNIFLVEVDGDIFIKLLDFGVAKIQGKDREELTTTGEMIGTMVYMSPEQLLDARNVDYRADLWSLAVVAYRAITTELPFNDVDGVGALILQLDRAKFPPASEYRKNLPPAVDEFFLRAFSRNPGDRFQTARELANEFLVAIGSSDRPSVLTQTGDALPRVTPPLDPMRETTPDLPQHLSGTRLGLGAPKPSEPASPPPAPASTVTDDPGTAGGAAPLTFSGGRRESRSSRRSTLRNAVIGFLSAVVLGFVALAYLKRGPAPSAPTSDPRSASPPPSAAAKPAPAESAAKISDAPTVNAATSSAPTATLSATAAPTAAPSASARAGKGRLPNGQRPPNNEKDYGF